jgi:hypothetical protein
MPKVARLILLALLPVPALCAASKPTGPGRITVAQLEQSLAAADGQTDAQVNQQLAGMELSERLSAAKFAQLNAALLGEKSRLELLILADHAAFLKPRCRSYARCGCHATDAGADCELREHHRAAVAEPDCDAGDSRL